MVTFQRPSSGGLMGGGMGVGPSLATKRRGPKQQRYSRATLTRLMLIMLSLVLILYILFMISVTVQSDPFNILPEHEHAPTTNHPHNPRHGPPNPVAGGTRQKLRPIHEKPVLGDLVKEGEAVQDKDNRREQENQNQQQQKGHTKPDPRKINNNNKKEEDDDDDNNVNNDTKQSGEVPTDGILRAYTEEIDYSKSWWDATPLPVRTKTTAQASKLTKIEFPKVKTCSTLLEDFPVDEYPSQDPFLPWIHDIFPSHDGTHIQFVAQNMRRCKTGKKEDDILEKMQPQVAIFQDVAVKRLTTSEIKTLEDTPNNDNKDTPDGTTTTTRYRLASHDEADEDGMSTRFICRFKPSGEETLSTYNVNYEFASFRKGGQHTFTKEGRDLKSLHTSQFLFQCPVPPSLQSQIKDGSSVQKDVPSIFIDLIPIRTPPRYGKPNEFLPPRYKEHEISGGFNPNDAWGQEHILPKIVDSGRWENLPICKPSLHQYEPHALDLESLPSAQKSIAKVQDPKDEESGGQNSSVKKHRLIACVWASASYHTRGERFSIDDGQRRLKEWLTYNFMTGFDHIYVYDNTMAHTLDTDLSPVTNLFPDQVTRIPWRAKVCNNNKNNVDSPGERSSQYAAESSCRLRFGPHAEWLGGFDIDEYLVPLGKYDSVPQLLDKLDEEGKKIINFGSWRAWPRKKFIEEPKTLTGSRNCGSGQPCFEVRIPPETTMLQAYNCDRQRGQKKKVMPAEKQIYRPDYVKLHFVHFTTMTELSVMSKTETLAAGLKYHPRVASDPASRYSDEESEGTMLHTKAMATQDTAGWQKACKDEAKGTCRIGNPYPPGAFEDSVTHDEDGWLYNCFVNDKADDYWVPKLEKALADHDQ